MNPMSDESEGTYRGVEGTASVSTASPKIAEGKTSYDLSWKVKKIMKKKKKKKNSRGAGGRGWPPMFLPCSSQAIVIHFLVTQSSIGNVCRVFQATGGVI